MAFALVRFRIMLYLVVMVVLVIKRCTVKFCTISYQTSFKIYTHSVFKVPGAFYLRHSEAVVVSKNGTMHENNKKCNIYKCFQFGNFHFQNYFRFIIYSCCTREPNTPAINR